MNNPEDMPDFRTVEGMVYQAVVDNNWEILTQRGFNGNRYNISMSPGTSENLPKINSAGDRIAFNSDRTGKAQIFTMNLSGEYVTRVTYDTYNDYQADWFPDGTKIVYVTDRNGSDDIYSINLDGSGNTRLTYNGQDDFNPVVSPDGSKIAFVRSNAGYGTLYLMDVDGTDQVPISPSYHYLQHPAWSPDGSHIGFDCDCNNNEWNELAQIHPDGTNFEVLFDFAASTYDLWMGNYSDTNNGIIFTLAIWYWTGSEYNLYQTYLESIRFNPFSRIDMNGYGSYSMFPDSKNLDTTPPSSQVTLLPEYIPSSGFTVSWSGADNWAGIHGYDVQYRYGLEGTWTNLIPSHETVLPDHAVVTSVNFTGTPGETAFFQSRAIDWAGNIEAFPGGDGDTHTKIFTHILQGSVTDNRGNALGNATITLSPAAWLNPLTDASGQFLTHLIASGTQTWQITRPGLGSWSEVTHSITNSTILDPDYLPPTENAITDGDFEEAPPDWVSAGNLPPMSDSNMFDTGAKSLKFSNIGNLGSGINLSNTPYWTGTPEMVCDTTGAFHTVWPENPTNNLTGIYYAMKPFGGSWTTPVLINPSATRRANVPDIALDSQNHPHVTWMEATTNENFIMASEMDSSGVWSTPDNPSGAYSRQWSSDQVFPQIAIDKDDTIHLIWGEFNSTLKYAQKTEGGSWTAKEAIPDSHSNFYYHRMVIDSIGTVHIVSIYVPYTRYITRSHEGVWSSATNLDSGAFYYGSFGMTIAADDSITLVGKSGTSNNQLYSTTRSPSGVWVDSTLFASDTEYTQNPILSPGPDGRLIAAWITSSSGKVYYRIRFPDGSWSQAILLIPSLGSAQYDLVPGLSDQIGMVRVMSLGIPDSDIFGYNFEQPQLTHASISQTITVPAGNAPTLAFMVNNEYPTNLGALEIWLDDTRISTLSPTSSAWSLAWVDLSDWQDQTVDLKISLDTNLGEGLQTLYLDDVSVGINMLPRIDSISPKKFQSEWVGQVITIQGDNFIAPVIVFLDEISIPDVVFIDASTLQFTLPEGIPPGTYDLRVVNPSDQDDSLPNALLLGRQFFLPEINRP